ncbi:hypothetical protein [Streptomyces sp. NPDC048111]|uniref:hypothetical protein n=1 Tax=Streptomyces sp. NPDC048111 TaxID=3365500 RepID=UPI0037216906
MSAIVDPVDPSQWAATSLDHFDQLARGTLRAARDAARVLRNASDDQHRAWALGVLAGRIQAMLGPEHRVTPPVGRAAEGEFVRTSVQLAVHALAHRWTEADLGLAGKAELPHLGERQAADAFDVLGRLMLPHSSPESWTATVLADLACGDETWEAVVKVGKYVLHPTFLGLADDLTRMAGEAVHQRNVLRLSVLADSVRRFTADPGHMSPPSGSEPTSRLRHPGRPARIERRRKGRTGVAPEPPADPAVPSSGRRPPESERLMLDELSDPDELAPTRSGGGELGDLPTVDIRDRGGHDPGGPDLGGI